VRVLEWDELDPKSDFAGDRRWLFCPQIEPTLTEEPRTSSLKWWACSRPETRPSEMIRNVLYHHLQLASRHDERIHASATSNVARA
jgi:hypothetical protein